LFSSLFSGLALRAEQRVHFKPLQCGYGRITPNARIVNDFFNFVVDLPDFSVFFIFTKTRRYDILKSKKRRIIQSGE
jgi:hypothetical protein